MKKRRALRLIAGGLATALLTGCAGPLHPRELQELQPVQTLGFDTGTAGEILVTASDPGDGEGAPPLRLAARGPGVAAAVEALGTQSPREALFCAHVRFVVLGEDAARSGAGEVLDWFERSTQTRLSLPLFVVRGGSAGELMADPETPDREISALLATVDRQTERRGPVFCFTVLDVARSLARSGAALCCAVRPAGEGGAPLPAGYAVLRDGALAGWLDEGESRGATLLLGKAGELSYVLDGVTAALRGTDVSLRPERDREGRPVLRITVSARAGVTGMADPAALTPALRDRLGQALSRALAADAEAALRASRELGADFLELGRLFDGSADLSALRWELRVRAETERSYDVDGGPALRGEEAA